MSRLSASEQVSVQDSLTAGSSQAHKGKLADEAPEVSPKTLLEIASGLSSQSDCTKLAAELGFSMTDVIKWKNSKDPVEDIAQDILLSWSAQTSVAETQKRSVISKALAGIKRPDLANLL